MAYSGVQDTDRTGGSSLPGTTWILTAPTDQELSSDLKSKIRFDLERLNAEGLQGRPEGLRALHYEYCINDHAEAIRDITAIDPKLQIQHNSPRRVGCRSGKLLCLGHTHQPDHRTVLEQLAMLPYVAEIREACFE